MKNFMRVLIISLCAAMGAHMSCAYVAKEFVKGSMYQPEKQGSATGSAVRQESAPATVYVTIRNHCSNTVKLFIGEKPPYSSGIETSVSGNSVDSRTIAPGTLVWILDDSGNPVSSTSVSAGTSEIHINSSGTGFGEN